MLIPRVPDVLLCIHSLGEGFHTHLPCQAECETESMCRHIRVTVMYVHLFIAATTA